MIVGIIIIILICTILTGSAILGIFKKSIPPESVNKTLNSILTGIIGGTVVTLVGFAAQSSSFWFILGAAIFISLVILNAVLYFPQK